MSKKHRDTPEIMESAAAVDTFTSEGERVPSTQGEPPIAQLGVHGNGPDYASKAYRYDRLADALAAARLMRSPPAAQADVGAPRQHTLVAPIATEETVMASLGIRFDGSAFCVGRYRYDSLMNAVKYVRRGNGPH